MAKIFDKVSLDSGKIGQMIAIIGERSTALKRDIQVCAVSCALHAAMHADITLMQKLDDTLGDGWYRNTLRAWAVKQGPFGYRVKAEDGKPVGFTYIKAKADALKQEYQQGDAACITRLLGQPWEKAKAEPNFEGFDLLAVLTKAASKSHKYETDPVKSAHPKTKINPKLLAELEDLVRKYASDASTADGGNIPNPASVGEYPAQAETVH